jgi:hypothetical protein
LARRTEAAVEVATGAHCLERHEIPPADELTGDPALAGCIAPAQPVTTAYALKQSLAVAERFEADLLKDVEFDR